jgi:hypothetical protein
MNSFPFVLRAPGARSTALKHPACHARRPPCSLQRAQQRCSRWGQIATSSGTSCAAPLCTRVTPVTGAFSARHTPVTATPCSVRGCSEACPALQQLALCSRGLRPIAGWHGTSLELTAELTTLCVQCFVAREIVILTGLAARRMAAQTIVSEQRRDLSPVAGGNAAAADGGTRAGARDRRSRAGTTARGPESRQESYCEPAPHAGAPARAASRRAMSWSL